MRKLTLPLLLIATLLMSACARNPLPVPVLSPPVTLQPGIIPSQQPTIAADLPPDQQLAAAKLLLHNGNFQAAHDAFQQITLNPGLPPETIADASFGIGQSALRQGSFATALPVLDNFITNYPTHSQVATALFMRGNARLGVGDWAGGIADYQAYLSQRPGLADSYVYERIGDANIALGQTDQAIAAYEQAIVAGRDLSSLVDLRERAAQVHLNAGNAQGAIDQYNAILNVARIPAYRAKIDLLLADAYFAAGDGTAGNNQLLYVANTYPSYQQSFNALQKLELANLADTVDIYQRGLIEFNAGAYAQSEQSFYNWLALADFEHPPDAHFFRARSYVELANLPAAITEYQTIIDTHQDDPQWQQALLELAAAQAIAGDITGSLTTINTFVDEYPESPLVGNALLQAATLMDDIQNVQQARDYYVRLQTHSPGDEVSIEGLLQVAVAYYQLNQLTDAELVLSAIRPDAQGQKLASINLWLGRIYLAQGRSDEAAAAFATATAADPGSYYALRAADLQANRPLFAPPPAITYEFDDAADRTIAEAWLASTFNLTTAPPYTTLRPDLTADVRMIRAQELWNLGLIEEALLEFESLRFRLHLRPPRLLPAISLLS